MRSGGVQSLLNGIIEQALQVP
ncbi:hypothetical protein [Microbacterium sp. ZXX196]|nr:hypothetical protein [Microbacterium sp. ZXX196]